MILLPPRLSARSLLHQPDTVNAEVAYDPTTARGTAAQTRERISNAALALFQENGYARTSVRDIAAAAVADPALVIRHFGSKELFFLEIMHPTLDDPQLAVPLDQLGRRFIDVVLSDAQGSRGVYLALVQGSDEPSMRSASAPRTSRRSLNHCAHGFLAETPSCATERTSRHVSTTNRALSYGA